MTNKSSARYAYIIFFQFPKEKGTGLGLAVIKGIVDKHKGMIDVKSVVGQGTKFDVTLKVSA